MHILMLAINDPAGAAMTLCRALNTHTPHTARLATLETRYNHDFPRDIHIPDASPEQLAELGELFRASDVFHFHMTADEFTRFGPFLPADYLAGKTVVHHHHGHPDFRGNPQKYQKKYAERGRRNLLVSTPDLLPLLPGAIWQPNTVPVNDPAYMPLPQYGLRENTAEPVRIGHSPTNKALKNTDEFLLVTKALRHDSALPASEVDLMDCVPHEECLIRKRSCDIFFDHMQGYFGMSSLEALSQAVPTIAGLDAWNLRHIESFSGQPSPWIVARDQAALERTLRDLLPDADKRRELGARARQFMETGWSDDKVAQFLAAWYAGLQSPRSIIRPERAA